MKKVRLLLALAGLFATSVTLRAQFADAVISYSPGTGFAAGYTNTSAALGAPASGGSVTPFAPPFSKSQLVSIGAGGEITLQMSTPILNNPADPFGINFMIFANEFFISSGGNVSGLFYHQASIQVQVSADDSTWYTLNPALAPQAGELYPTDGSGNPLIPINPSLTISNFTGLNLAGIRGLYAGSAGGTGYDLAWAQDANSNSVDLASAGFVRIEVSSGVLDLDAVSVVPEPGTAVLALIGGGLFCLFQRMIVRRERRARIKPIPALRFGLLLTLASAFVSAGRATTFTENFTNNPSQDGWQVFGDTNLFQWDSTNLNMDVTWDSSQTNSYFHHPLGTVLTRNDDFCIAFDLKLNVAEASGYGFELAIGLFNLSEATSTNFNRSTGENSPDLVEFDFFPDVGYGPTVWPLFVDSNSLFNYNGPSDYAIYAPILGDWYHVVMSYTASNQTMVTTLTNFEQTSGVTIDDPILITNFTDFRVDTLSISSYEDDGLGDSIYAQGVVGNFVLHLPPPAIQNFAGALTNAVWQCQFVSQSNWLYTLQRTVDLQSWTVVSGAAAGNGTNLSITDTAPPPDHAFYRISANRP